MDEIAFAKINLALHVRAREPDGYHRIETLFAFAEEGDRLSVSPAETLELRLTGPFADRLERGPDNLVLMAATALRDHCSVGAGAALVLDKQLPVSAGIGGGSADAAAALRLLVRFWNLQADQGLLLDIASSLGADVPACLSSRTALGVGRGDRLRPAGLSLTGIPALLINPGVPVSTAEVFRRWDGCDRGALPAINADMAVNARNDLEAPAISIAPGIADVLAELRSVEGVRLARMSGSGATCFALFDTIEARDQARDRIARSHPGWWQMATRLR